MAEDANAIRRPQKTIGRHRWASGSSKSTACSNCHHFSSVCIVDQFLLREFAVVWPHVVQVCCIAMERQSMIPR